MNTTPITFVTALLLSFTASAQPIQPEVLFSFPSGGASGWAPRAALALASDDNFYGTTQVGGTAGVGAIFKITPDGTMTWVVSLNSVTGSYPQSPMTRGDDGNLYGTAAEGGSASSG